MQIHLSATNYHGWFDPVGVGTNTGFAAEDKGQQVIDPPAPAGFSLQYGLAPSGWLTTGTGFESKIGDQQFTDPLNYSFTVTGFGKVIQIACTTGGGYYPNGVFIQTLMASSMQTRPVVIERSTDLVNWLPIYTNAACLIYSVDNFTDPAPPEDRAFYRLEIK